MDQNKVIEETLLNKETTIRKQKGEKELINKQNASEVQSKSIKDYRESIYNLNVQLEAKVQKAVSNSEETATSLLEKDNQIACMVTRKKQRSGNFSVRKRRSIGMYGNRNEQKSIIFEGANTRRTC